MLGALLTMVAAASPVDGLPVDAPDRSQPPPVVAPTPWALPEISASRSGDGYRVQHVELSGASDVEYRILFHVPGGANDPASRIAVDLWTAETVLSPPGWLDLVLDDLSMAVDSYSAGDAVVVSAVGLRTLVLPTVDVLEEIVYLPRYRRAHIRQAVREAVRSMTKDTSPSFRADEALRWAWDDPSRGRSIEPRDWRRVKRKDVLARHEAWRRSRVTVLVVGEVPDPLLEHIGEVLDPAAPLDTEGTLPEAEDRQARMIGVDLPGSTQAAIRLRTAAPRRGSVEDASMRVLDITLGQGFGSVIHSTLVGDLGLAYDVWASHQRAAVSPHWTIQTSVRPQDAAEALQTIQRILEDVAKDGIDDIRRRGAWATSTRLWNESVESPYMAGQFYEDLALAGESVATAEGQLAEIGRVTSEQLSEVAGAYLLSGQLWVVCGDRGVLGPQLAAAGFVVDWQ